MESLFIEELDGPTFASLDELYYYDIAMSERSMEGPTYSGYNVFDGLDPSRDLIEWTRIYYGDE
jgi:hypothetical protein